MFRTNPKYKKTKDNVRPEFLLIWRSQSGRQCCAQYTRKEEAEERLEELVMAGVCGIKTERRYFAGYISI